MRTTASITDFTENVTSKAARNKDWYCEQGIKQQRLIWHRGMDTEFEWQKIKADKKMTRLFSIDFNVLDFSTPCFFLFCFVFSQLFTRLKRSSSFRGKMIQKWSEGKQKLLRVSGRFELSGVNCILFKVKIICQTPTYSWN